MKKLNKKQKELLKTKLKKVWFIFSAICTGLFIVLLIAMLCVGCSGHSSANDNAHLTPQKEQTTQLVKLNSIDNPTKFHFNNYTFIEGHEYQFEGSLYDFYNHTDFDGYFIASVISCNAYLTTMPFQDPTELGFGLNPYGSSQLPFFARTASNEFYVDNNNFTNFEVIFTLSDFYTVTPLSVCALPDGFITDLTEPPIPPEPPFDISEFAFTFNRNFIGSFSELPFVTSNQRFIARAKVLSDFHIQGDGRTFDLYFTINLYNENYRGAMRSLDLYSNNTYVDTIWSYDRWQFSITQIVYHSWEHKTYTNDTYTNRLIYLSDGDEELFHNLCLVPYHFSFDDLELFTIDQNANLQQPISGELTWEDYFPITISLKNPLFDFHDRDIVFPNVPNTPSSDGTLLITNTFDGLSGIFGIAILPGLTLGLLLFIPLIFAVILGVIKLL